MGRDRAGTAATIATRLAEQKISIESIVQRHPDGVDVSGAAKKPSPVPVILITYATHEDAVYRALEAGQRDKGVSRRPQGGRGGEKKSMVPADGEWKHYNRGGRTA